MQARLDLANLNHSFGFLGEVFPAGLSLCSYLVTVFLLYPVPKFCHSIFRVGAPSGELVRLGFQWNCVVGAMLLYENASGNKLVVGAGACLLEPLAHREPLLQVFARGPNTSLFCVRLHSASWLG
jgi:hypothetical protein